MPSFFGRLSTLDKNKLTSKEKRIIEYIRNNLTKIADNEWRIETLTKAINVGNSAMYGLIKKLSFNGYRDFLTALIDDATVEKPLVAKNDQQVADNYVSLIKQNYSIIDKKSLVDTLKLLKKGTRIFVTYWEGLLRGPASEMRNFLFTVNLNAYLLDSDWDTIISRVNALQKDDLYIFYTQYGNSKHLERVIEMIKEKGGKVIFISGRLTTPKLSKLSDSIHTLIIDNVDANGRQKQGIVSKTVPYHYFNDLLFYHFKNGTN